MTTATIPMTNKKPVRRGFPSLPCIRCGNTDGNVRLDLDDVDTFNCVECDEQFTAGDVRDFIGQWKAVLAWIDAAPVVAE
ncbi:MAG TPA: hypothetical protein VH643_03415 [Gemmataceae bacterium]